ncbi:MAG: UDP-N-acetylglucosamine 2-epimerase (non-hydrolyzing), partial [Bacteroidetes bacterium]|nr:UDP-N-acetylglucosamine 2-epimerase (non-hydrolyzing) [Bacteroidota bacterium]
MHSILSIIGARPQFIKHAALQPLLQRHFRALSLHTGQHFDGNMSGSFFDELQIPKPDFQLGIGAVRGQAAQTARMMEGIERICLEQQPDAVLIYGDTNTTLAGALVAVKLQIPIFHVEAGIRGFNRALPEEVNRIIADTFSSLLFCPTQEAVENLQREGIRHEGVLLTGDVMCDMLEAMRQKIKPFSTQPYYYATIHRPYNTDDPARLRRILNVLQALDHPVYFPLHPRTQHCMEQAGIASSAFPNVHCLAPVGYLESLSFQAGAACVLTDSSGVQKEAYMLRRKCITLRSETEWHDTLKEGWNRLVFEDLESISDLVHSKPGYYVEGLFGDGGAGGRIAER